MSIALRQFVVAAVSGIVMIGLVVGLLRRGRLTFRYALGWMTLASLGILASLFIPLFSPVANVLGFTAPAFLGLIALTSVVVISIQLSISISGLQGQVRVLVEEIARLRQLISDRDS